MSSDKKLEADPVSVLSRFDDEVELACPLFQRRFVWKSGNIDQLWADIDTVLDGEYSKRFLGALVFNNESSPTASRMGRYWIIDGQQRLTTLYLILVAIADVSADFDEPGKALGQDTFATYLVSARQQTKSMPKLRPTLVDTKQFQTIILGAANRCGAPVKVNPALVAGDLDGAMNVGYRRLVTSVRNRIKGDNPLGEPTALDALIRIRDTVLEQLELVEIRLGEEHDPNEVFDRLNKEGERLGIVDLVRNEVLKHLDSEPAQALSVFSQEWKPFEDGFADEAAKAKYFFPFALTLNEGATQATTFRTLRDQWTQLAKSGLPNDVIVKQMVNDLRRHQSAYNAIHSGRYNLIDEPIRERVRRLHDLGAPSVIYPYVIQLLTAASEGAVSENQAANCLDVVESFLVRRAFLGMEPTGLHAVFKKLWNKAAADPNEVRANIVSNTIKFPDDTTFINAIATESLYHRRICRYVLEEYERKYTAGDVLEVFPAITIDHVAPQSLKGDWEEIFATPADQALLHTWGNLVPLSNEANSTKGTLNWTAARSKLQHETVFATTKHLYDTHPNWGPAEVQARGESLVDWALARWPSYA